MARRRRKTKSNPLVLLIFLVGATIVIGSLCVFTSSKQPTATWVVVPTTIPPTPTPQQMEPSGAGDILLASTISALLSTILTVVICVRIYRTQVTKIFYRLDSIDRLVAALRRKISG